MRCCTVRMDRTVTSDGDDESNVEHSGRREICAVSRDRTEVTIAVAVRIAMDRKSRRDASEESGRCVPCSEVSVVVSMYVAKSKSKPTQTDERAG